MMSNHWWNSVSPYSTWLKKIKIKLTNKKNRGWKVSLKKREKFERVKTDFFVLCEMLFSCCLLFFSVWLSKIWDSLVHRNSVATAAAAMATKTATATVVAVAVNMPASLYPPLSLVSSSSLSLVKRCLFSLPTSSPS